MSGGTILLQPLLVDGVHTLPLERSPELLEQLQIPLRRHCENLARVIFDPDWADNARAAHSAPRSASGRVQSTSARTSLRGFLAPDPVVLGVNPQPSR